MSMQEIKSATVQDHTFQELKEIIAHNSWHLLKNAKHLPTNVDVHEIQALSRVQQDLCISSNGDMMLRGNCIVISIGLQCLRSLHIQSATCKSCRPCTTVSFRNC